MLADWSIECGADDPVLVVPWSSSAGDAVPPHFVASHFIDLRENPYDLDHLIEAERHPAIMHALRALNANRSPVYTAKCDAWSLEEEELPTLRNELELSDLDAPAGFGGYIDLLWRDRPVFASFHQHEQILHRIARHCGALDHPFAMIDCVLRPALIDFSGAQEGFAISLYVKALGHDAQAAYQHWSQALESIVALLRVKDMALA